MSRSPPRHDTFRTQMPITWPDSVDEIIGGDLTAALAYVTPAGGAVVTAVAPVGLRDRAAGTVTFTTSLGLGRKLERIARNPRVALAYHAREHGFAQAPGFVLVQGDAQPATEPDRSYLEGTVRPQATRFMGPPKEGKLFWDRWLREYYQDRIPVAVDVERLTVWADDRCAGLRDTLGAAAAGEPPAQDEPAKGAGPARRLRACRGAPALAGPPAAGVRRRRRLPGGRPGTGRGRRPGGHPPHVRAPAPTRGSPRGHARALVPAQADRPRCPPAHRLADRGRGGRPVRAAHRVGIPRPGEQDGAAAGERAAREARPAQGAPRAAATLRPPSFCRSEDGVRPPWRRDDLTDRRNRPRHRATGAGEPARRARCRPGPVRGDQRRLRRPVRRRAGRDAGQGRRCGAPRERRAAAADRRHVLDLEDRRTGEGGVVGARAVRGRPGGPQAAARRALSARARASWSRAAAASGHGRHWVWSACASRSPAPDAP